MPDVWSIAISRSAALLPISPAARERVEAFNPTWFFATALSAFVLLTYFIRPDALPTRGEETRWATVAHEMAATGDWIVPRQQGEPFFSRPPLGSWLIAVSAMIRGEFDLVSVRLPTTCAVLAIALLVMRYAAKTCPPEWAFLSGLAFASCAQVLQLGRVAETDMVFAALVAGSMLGWRGAWKHGSPTLRSWLIGYGLAGLGTLAKGPQAPAYFIAAAGLCLLIERRWKTAFTRSHAIGLLAFLAVLLAWHLPIISVVGVDGMKAFWTGDVKLRWVDVSAERWAFHLTTFPLEVLACFLPWSFAFLPLVRRDVRREVAANPHARFALIALCVAFPTCWFTPGAKVRYFLPLFPQFAVLVGCVLTASVRIAGPSLSRGLRTLDRSFIAVLISGAATMLVGSLLHWKAGLFVSPPLAAALVFLLGSLLCAGVVWKTRRKSIPNRILVLSSTAAFAFALADNLVRLPMLVATSVDTQNLVADLRRRYDSEGPIPSIGPVHHRFAFFYRDPIPYLDQRNADRLPVGSLFTLTPAGAQLFKPPFPYETLAVVSCDRNVKLDGPSDYVVLGRRLPAE